MYYLPGGDGSSPAKVASCVWENLYDVRDDLDADLLLLADDPRAAAEYPDVAITPSEARDHVAGAVFYYPLNPVLGLGPRPRALMRLRRMDARLACDFHGDVREDLYYHLLNRDIGLFLFSIPTAALAPWMVNWPELIVMHSRYHERIVRGHYSIRARTEIVPNGIDAGLLDHPPPSFRLEGGPSVFYHGRLAHEKGVDLLVEAMAALPSGLRGTAHLHVSGGGPLRRSLGRRAARLGLEGQVHLLGHLPIEEVYARIRAADMVVYPSRYDNFPVAVLEALALAEGPVIMSDHMGLVELTGPGLAADIIEPTASAVRDSIVRVAGGSGDLAAIVKEQRALARSLTWDRVARRYLEVLNGIQ